MTLEELHPELWKQATQYFQNSGFPLCMQESIKNDNDNFSAVLQKSNVLTLVIMYSIDTGDIYCMVYKYFKSQVRH